MKKNDTFATPQRQSQLAIIFIIFRFVKNVLKQAWPIFAAILLGRGTSSAFNSFELALTGLGVIGIVPSVIAYFKYYYHLNETELVIDKGLFKKVRLNIPFERIQSVNFNQNFLHQMLNVTEVEIETAGSDSQETKIDALDLETANTLRERILMMKQQSGSNTVTTEGLDFDLVGAEEKETILSLSFKELFRVGLVQNHLKPLGVAFGILFTLQFYTDAFSFDFSGMIRDTIEQAEEVRSYFNFSYNIVYLIIALLLGSFVVSMIMTILKYYDLQFWRKGAKFQAVYGLFNRREYAALDNKIQILKWGQNILERWIGFYNITFAQARSSDEKKESGSIRIPGCDVSQIRYVQEAWLGPDVTQDMVYQKVSMHMFWHTAIYVVLIGLAASGLFGYFGYYIQSIGSVLLVILLLGLSWLEYKKKRYALNGSELYVGGGTVGLRHALLPLYKIQGVKIQSNPYQWRRKLASLVVYTAGGKVVIPYIPQQTASQLMDQLLYHVEVAKQDWM